MQNKLPIIGRVFFGIAIAGMGFLTVYYRDFPYMLIPPKHAWIPGLMIVAYCAGTFFILTGGCIIFKKKIVPASLLLGTVLLLVFCFYFIPYQIFVSQNNKEFGDWENAAKELTLCSGAFVIASAISKKAEYSAVIRFLNRLAPFGVIFFSLTIISYGLDHYLYAKDAADYVPSWIPYHLFWIYFTGTALICAALAILLKIKSALAATLLGTMIFTWFVILHIPRIIASEEIYLGSEIASALLALAYSGIAFVVSATNNDLKNP